MLLDGLLPEVDAIVRATRPVVREPSFRDGWADTPEAPRPERRRLAYLDLSITRR